LRVSTRLALTANDRSGNSGTSKRFTLHRSATKNNDGEKSKRADDLSQMMSRASNFMTISYAKIPSVVLCLSYKGKGERNFVDVHDFVFRMPTLEYRNKTWSNMDLVLALKKDVIKALISHTGAIIGNKLSQHRPSKQPQSRLREITTTSSLVTSSSHNSSSYDNSETSSLLGSSPGDERSQSPRRSFASGRASQLTRSESFSSSPKNISGSELPSSDTANEDDDVRPNPLYAFSKVT
jgi:hypothetical protein